MLYKKGSATPTQLIAGALLILGGALTLIGRANLGAVFGGLALLVEALEIMLRFGA